MRLPDIFRLNDWQIRRFNLFILSILIAYNAIFLTDKFLLKIPILPQLFGFIILTFIPGFIILRILKVHDIDKTQNFLLAVGSSLSFIMIFGLFLNTLLPPLGISRPMSPEPLFYAFNIGILALLLASYLRDRDFKPSSELLTINISPLMLSLLLLPFLSVFGAYIMTFYDSNLLILILLFLISLTPVAVAFNKIPEDLYSFLIFVVSLSILYHVNLISTHLWSFDIFPWSYATNRVIENRIWDPHHEHASLLLFGALAPTYAILCNLSSVWVFKIIFPFFFALAPLALYQVYQRFDFGDWKIDPRLALLSVFVFVFFYGFFKDMPDKQHIAQLFLSLILMLMVTNIPNRVPMSIIFSFSLITSHYGVSYVFMLSVVFALLLLYIWKKRGASLLTSNFVLFFSVLAISWYMHVALGTIFEAVVGVGYHILTHISEIFIPDCRAGIAYLAHYMPTIAWEIYRLIHIALQFFIAIGMLKLLLSIFKRKIGNLELPFLSIAFYSLLVFQITVTFGMGFDRVLQITLVLLSPLALVGCIFVFKTLKKIISPIYDLRAHPLPSIKFFAVFLAILFLFGSGFVFEVVDDTLPPYSIALSRTTWKYWNAFHQSEVDSMSWLKTHGVEYDVAIFNPGHVIISRDGLLASGFHSTTDLIRICVNTTELTNSHVFIGKFSNINLEDTLFYSRVLSKSNKIYDSGNAIIYFVNRAKR
ncbi:MAG: hypothetical protein DDT40_00662 [candidate division WS2 bacterium]|nr:hypothetical protein [Candidatus Psychracetigena formicireducens]